MHAWEAIQRTLDYIEENIHEEIDIGQLANEAALSPFYYQRLFSRLVKKTVREYIKLRRLARACETLRDKRRRILDVALECGFHSHEAFTRAFKEAYGMTPEWFREQPCRLNHFDKPDLLLHYTMVDEGVPLITDGLVLEINRRKLEQPVCFMGIADSVSIAQQVPPGESTGVDAPGEIWGRFHREKHSIPRIPGGRELGVSYLGGAPEGCFTYFAGAEVEQTAAHAHFAEWQLPAREYVVCGFESEDFERLVTVALSKAIQFSQAWLERHCLTMDAFSPEMYYDSSPDAAYMELWLPA